MYFANSGLRTRLDLLTTGQSWWSLVVLIIIASIAKIGPVTLTAKLCKRKPWRYCAAIGVLMNTRGIVQLVVLNIGVELKVISPIIFAIFVLMATILTFLTSPILSFLYKEESTKDDLSMDHIAEELSKVRNSYVNMNSLENGSDIVSITAFQNEEQRRNASHPIPSQPLDPLRCDSFLTPVGESYQPQANAIENQSNVLHRIVVRPIVSRKRSSYMTHF